MAEEKKEKEHIYKQVIEHVFFKHYKKGDKVVTVKRPELVEAAIALKIKGAKNIGDNIYTYRHRADLPERIDRLAPEGYYWVIRSGGRSIYSFELAKGPRIIPNAAMSQTKILDSTPGIVTRYAMNDEQALLAKIRYNRLIDIFSGITCYSLQNHLRTKTDKHGQIETDEIYVGVDKRGAQFVLPVQAKSKKDRIGIVQIEQDIALCEEKFPNAVAKPIAAQVMDQSLIALFEFEDTKDGVRVVSEKHYRLVTPDQLSAEELASYKARTE